MAPEPKWYVRRTDETERVTYYLQGDDDTSPSWVKKTASATSFVAEEYAWSAARGIAAVYINSKIKASKNNVALPVYAFDAVSG